MKLSATARSASIEFVRSTTVPAYAAAGRLWCTAMIWQWIKRTYLAARSATLDVLSILFLIRFSALMSALASLVILVPDQISEVLRMMAEPLAFSVFQIVLFFLALVFLAFSAWYWARVSIYALRPAAISTGGAQGWAARNLPRLVGIMPVMASALAFARADIPETGTTSTSAATNLHWLSISCLALGVAIYVFLFYRSRLFGLSRPTVPTSGVIPWQLPRVTWIVLAGSGALGFLSFVLFTIWPVVSTTYVGAAALVLVWAGTWIPIGAILAYLGSASRVPILALLLVSAIVYGWLDLNDNHVIRHEAGVRDGLPPEFGGSFETWLANRADRDRYHDYPVFFVAAEGGGIRAAYFTALVLTAIQDRCPAFAQHVFAISGVSGGSLGAAVFAGLVKRHAANAAADEACSAIAADTATGPLQEQADDILNRDFLTPLLAALLYPDLVQRFLPVPIPVFDRARALEHSFERAWTDVTGGDEFSRSFHELWRSFPEEATPALLLNTTDVETGLPVLVSNLLLLDERFERTLTLTDINWTMDMPLSTAVGLSARFPFVTPAGTIPIGADAQGRPVDKQRLVDGGYFENSGTATIQNVIDPLRLVENKDRYRVVPVILVIENGQALTNVSAAAERRAPAFPALPRYDAEGFGELLSPIRTLMNTREARGTVERLQTETAVTTLLDQGLQAEHVTFALSPGPVPIPLGWALSEVARLEMQRQLGVPRDCASRVNIENPCSLGDVVRILGDTVPAMP